MKPKLQNEMGNKIMRTCQVCGRQILNTDESIVFCSEQCRAEQKTRRTGRTTLIALQTFARCYEQPKEWFRISDHFGTRNADEFLFNYMQRLANDMRLKFEFTKTGTGFFIRLGEF